MARKARNRPAPRKAQGKEELSKQGPGTGRAVFWAALYIRLSKADAGTPGADTVENQRALLEDYVKKQADIKVSGIYLDHGYSGTGFRRPAFMKMMEDARGGKVNCIIVKDLSRLGRNYLEVGDYLETVFPFLKLRFISVTDALDTYAPSFGEEGAWARYGMETAGSIEIPLKNIINEAYARDISRKISSALLVKKQEGRHGGGFAPYGYQKSRTEKGKYEIDQEAAEVVREVFKLRQQGMRYFEIAALLNKRGVKPPGAYRWEKGLVKDGRYKDGTWKAHTIKSILQDQVYLGNMVRGKTHTALYRGEKRHHVPKEEWIVTPRTHTPIIEPELFGAVQQARITRGQQGG